MASVAVSFPHNLSLSKTDIKLLNEIEENIIGDWETKAIEKGKKFTK